jgi:subtilase family serine protease
VGESVVPLAEHTPRQVIEGTATRLGRYSPEQKLRLTLAVRPPHLAEEEAFLRQLVDRESPNFHKFLTAEQWNARFAPSAEAEQAVVDWARSQGLTVTHRFDHRLLVDVEAPAGVIEKAFAVTINRYQYRDELDFSNDRDPVIPARLQGILFNVEGLNSIQHDHSSRPGPASKAADYAEGPAYSTGEEGHIDAKAGGIPPSSAYARSELASNDSPNYSPLTDGSLNPTGVYSSQVYNYDGLQNLGHCCNPQHAASTPKVSNIAIAAFGLAYSQDVLGFLTAYPYLAGNWTFLNVDGTIACGSGYCPSVETTQDLEWTMATANSFASSDDTSHIYVYIGANFNNSTFTDMYGHMLSDDYARVFTTSWSCTEFFGCPTATMDARHNIFNAMVGQGWTLIAASGDRGASDDCTHESTAYPGTDDDVLAAGGTQLQTGPNGNFISEQGWQGSTYPGACSQNAGGSGGGVSSYYARPSWQSNESGSYRYTPDISLNAVDGQNLYIYGALQCCANGTSIVAPELAGFFAQENAYLSYIGNICGLSATAACTPVGNPMPFFYNAAISNEWNHAAFYDMTAGCNNNDVTAFWSLGYYCSTTGYDQVTGWGSANMLQLAWAINGQLIPSFGRPSTAFSGPAKNTWYNTNQKVSWTIEDFGGGSYPGTGIAGFTQGWDSLPPDSISKPNGGTNDSYYWGPQYANLFAGCLSFTGKGGCAGGASQGCHYAYVRGWNNQGATTGVSTYGPICYDYTPPQTTATVIIEPGLPRASTRTIDITLSASDKYSGVNTIWYEISGGGVYSPGWQVYGPPIRLKASSAGTISFKSVDNAGNWESVKSVPF